MRMRIGAVVSGVLFSVTFGANAFSAANKRVFVGTPVSNFPKHLGKGVVHKE
jgi:hypothetical protein